MHLPTIHYLPNVKNNNTMLKNNLTFIFLLGILVQCTHAQTPAISDSVITNVQTLVANGTNAGIAIGVIDTQGTHF